MTTPNGLDKLYVHWKYCAYLVHQMCSYYKNGLDKKQ